MNTQEVYNNPALVQSMILKDIEKRLLGGDPITDVHSPFMYLVEMASTIAASSIEATTNTFSALNKNRVKNMDELYRHISDYDNIHLFAEPSTTSVSIVMDKDVLFFRSKTMSENDDYKKIVIPADSSIIIANYRFSTYYPIVITINKKTQGVIVQYDNTIDSPFHVLQDNYLEHTEYRSGSTNILDIKVPIFQFSRKVDIFDSTKQTGFTQTINYDNQYYGIIVSHYLGGMWQPLITNYGDFNYKSHEPTAIVKVLKDTKQLKVSIPPIFFHKEWIGNKVRIETYTTMGKITRDLSNITAVDVSFELPEQLEDSISKQYSEVLTRLELLSVIPHARVIEGGKNTMSFTEARHRVQNRVVEDSLLVSPKQLTGYFQTQGFDVHLLRETIKDRVYIASNTIVMDGTTIPSGQFNIVVPFSLPEHLQNDYSVTDHSITLYPTIDYIYDASTKVARILTKEEHDTLHKSLVVDKEQFVELINDNKYLRTPYHLEIRYRYGVLYTNVYDHTNPTVENLRYVNDNESTPEHFTILQLGIIHNGLDQSSTDKYFKIRVQFLVTDGLKNVDIENLVRCYAILNHRGYQLTQLCNLISYDVTTGRGVYELTYVPLYTYGTTESMAIETDITGNTDVVGTWSVRGLRYLDLPLDHDINFLFTIETTSLPELQITPMELIQTNIDDNWTQVTLYRTDVHLGKLISDELYTSTQLVYNTGFYNFKGLYGEDLPRYQEDVIDVYQTDVPARTPSGIIDIIYAEDGNNYPIGIKYDHLKGEPILNPDGSPVVLYTKDEVVKDSSLSAQYRNKLLSINTLMLGTNLFYVDESATKDYIVDIATSIYDDYSKIKHGRTRLLENTWLKYRPTRSIGEALFFNQERSYFNHSLELVIKFRIAVDSETLKDLRLQSIIRREAIQVVEQQFATGEFSMTNISEHLRWTFRDVVRYIDVLGINGDSELQSFVIATEGVRPSLKQQLFVTDQGKIGVRKALDLIFV